MYAQREKLHATIENLHLLILHAIRGWLSLVAYQYPCRWASPDTSRP